MFPLAKVEVDEHPGARDWGLGARAGTAPGSAVPPGEVAHLKSCDDEWATDYELPPLQIMRVRLEGLSNVDPPAWRRERAGSGKSTASGGCWTDSEEHLSLLFHSAG